MKTCGQTEETKNEESLNQSEITIAEMSETDRIKSTYSFILPASRKNIIRIWDKRGNIKCSNSLS